jgi:hypothetical protein
VKTANARPIHGEAKKENCKDGQAREKQEVAIAVFADTLAPAIKG